MHKVVTTRPRKGGYGYSNRGRHLRHAEMKVVVDDEEGIETNARKRGKISRHDKVFSDLINPLLRYLRKQVGRPWNDVYSDVSKSLPKGLHRYHIRDQHVSFAVETQVEIIDGEPHSKPPYPHRLRDGALYVDPRDGILKRTKDRKRQKPKARDDLVKISDTVFLCRCKAGIWWEVTYKEPVTGRYRYRWGHFEDVQKVWTLDGTKYIAWRPKYSYTRRTLSKKEIRKHKLKRAA